MNLFITLEVLLEFFLYTKYIKALTFSRYKLCLSDKFSHSVKLRDCWILRFECPPSIRSSAPPEGGVTVDKIAAFQGNSAYRL